ncbi:MAG: hypothetical protein J5883_03850 [Clostridiales bacterium]|nr:hypothetical protein [Clostridiales bacterium]
MKKRRIIIIILALFIVLASTGVWLIFKINQNTTNPSIEPHNPEQARSSEAQSVINELITIRDTNEFKNASEEEKEQMLIDALEQIAESGTDEYPYSLVDPDSIYSTYHSVYFTVVDGTEQTFSFS